MIERPPHRTGDGFAIRTLSATYSDGFVIGGHDHPWGQLVYASSGIMHVEAERVLWFVPPTRAIWIPARRRHIITARGRVALRTLYIDPDRTDALAGHIVGLEVQPLLRELILHVAAAGMLDPSDASNDRLTGVVVDRIAAASPIDLWLPLPADTRATALALRLRDDPAQRTELADLAGQVGAGVRTIQRLFAAETGMSVEAWRQKARLVHAANALSAGANVTTAANASGYDSVSAFISAFRRMFGITPGKYRGQS